jgi:hypothetical protein
MSKATLSETGGITSKSTSNHGRGNSTGTDRRSSQVLQAAALQVHQLQPPVAPAAPAIQFAYGPGAYGLPTDLINYKTATGAKIQKSASEKLDIKFNLEFEHLFELLEQLLTRVLANHWISTIFAITRGQLIISILDHYGTVSEAEVLSKLRTYMFQGLRALAQYFSVFRSNINTGSMTNHVGGTKQVLD